MATSPNPRAGRVAVDDLVELLDLERLEVDLFRGQQPDTDAQRVFGGQVAAQALVAAGRTVAEDRHVHSLHAYFIRPGDPAVPIIYEVDRIRDGGSFTTRRAVAVQHGRAIFSLSASFARPEPGFAHQTAFPGAPDPETLPTVRELMERPESSAGDHWMASSPVDVRYVFLPQWALGESRVLPPEGRAWVKTRQPLPDDPLVHVAVMTYASDMMLLNVVLRPHAQSSFNNPRVQIASLDHAMWFHRSFRADDWLLYDQHSPAASAARGLATGHVFTRDGTLVCSVVQEGLIRPTDRRLVEQAGG